MNNKQKKLKFKKVQIASLELSTIKGGYSLNSVMHCEASYPCSQSIGTGETTSTTNNEACNLESMEKTHCESSIVSCKV